MRQAKPYHANWHVFQRWAQYDGELRSSLLRICCIGAFYLVHLWRYFSSAGHLPAWSALQISDGAVVDRRYHLLVTLLAAAWALLSANVFFMLRNRVFPQWLPGVSGLVDVFFLTSILGISNGPQSPLVVGYFLLIVLSGLRFSLPLVRLTTVTAMMGYIIVLGVAKWPERFGRDPSSELTVPRYHQLIVLLAIAITGVLVGQIVRRVRVYVAQPDLDGVSQVPVLRVNDMAALETHQRCHRCGAQLDSDAATCWLCGAEGETSTSAESNPYAPPVDIVDPSQPSLFSPLLIVVLVLVVIGLFAIAPGLGAFGTFMVLPVIVRTYMVVKRREQLGKTVSLWQKVAMFLSSMVVAYVIMTVVTFATFGALCAACLAGASVNASESAIFIAMGVAAVVGILVAIGMGYWVKARYQRAIHRP